MALINRIVLYLTCHSKSNQIPRTFLLPFSSTFCLTNLPINSAKLNCSSEVTLRNTYIFLLGLSVISSNRIFLVSTNKLVSQTRKLFLVLLCWSRRCERAKRMMRITILEQRSLAWPPNAHQEFSRIFSPVYNSTSFLVWK